MEQIVKKSPGPVNNDKQNVVIFNMNEEQMLQNQNLDTTPD